MIEPGSPIRCLAPGEKRSKAEIDAETKWWDSFTPEEQRAWLTKDRELREKRQARKDLISAVVIGIFAIVALAPVVVMLASKLKAGWMAW